MSMPAGFGTTASYSLPTSFSGNFQQPAFPAQAAFPQAAFTQQPNGKCLHTTFRFKNTVVILKQFIFQIYNL